MEERGLRKISTFITADALLAAVMMVWAQLWMQPSLQLWGKHYQPECGNIGGWFHSFNNSIGFGLAWAYSAVFLALLALAWSGWKTLSTPESKTPDTAIGLFAASVVMGLINVAQSVFSVTMKLFGGGLIYQPLDFELGRWFLFLIIPIVVLSVWGALWLNKDCKYSKYKYPTNWLCKLPWCLYHWLCRFLPWWSFKYLPWWLEVALILIAAGFALWLYF
jgi:hypothetical protein